MIRVISFHCSDVHILIDAISIIDNCIDDKQCWLILDQFEVYGESKYLHSKGESVRIQSLRELFIGAMPLFIKVQIYQAEDIYDLNIHTKQDFDHSHCSAIFLLYDCEHVELHSKDDLLMQNISKRLYDKKIEIEIQYHCQREKMDVKS